jgi:hypothetical protein
VPRSLGPRRARLCKIAVNIAECRIDLGEREAEF